MLFAFKTHLLVMADDIFLWNCVEAAKDCNTIRCRLLMTASLVRGQIQQFDDKEGWRQRGALFTFDLLSMPV